MQLARRDCENGKIFFAPQERHCAWFSPVYPHSHYVVISPTTPPPRRVIWSGWPTKCCFIIRCTSQHYVIPTLVAFSFSWKHSIVMQQHRMKPERSLTHSTSFPGRALFYQAKTRVFTSHNVKGKRERDVLKNGVKPSLATALAPFFRTHRFFLCIMRTLFFPFYYLTF